MSTQQTHPKQRTLDAAIPLTAERHPKIGWRIILTFILVLSLIILSLLAGRSSTAGASPLGRMARTAHMTHSVRPSLSNLISDSTALQNNNAPLVLAFYYSWFDETTWSLQKLSDLPAQPYASRDRGVMGRHIEQAQRAGIDAFVVAWYGPHGVSNQTEPNLVALLEEAAGWFILGGQLGLHFCKEKRCLYFLL
ncbi:hypothetical protein KFU94_37660 [Chloroflexi bacterium TSY]|nr:hypothetical protein [Chloroflexi bacterium TSY]